MIIKPPYSLSHIGERFSTAYSRSPAFNLYETITGTDRAYD